ncbi:hypothetical protein NA56DRAFT_641481 [Hyaloscypha hepaticicola]|uniref:Uncharacterized protein n=1 Tax=Hyaloscypha hepaticicola TaxID=2082293 RepID=A0A2J6QKQ8_9HELO|nr:hypothetical protein NA56DRAFT_641481 [Hyaloscypha hepaticicola]
MESQHQIPHLKQHSLGQAGPSMHSGRSQEDLDPFLSQGMVPIRQEPYTSPFAEASFTGVGSSPPESRVQSEEEIAQRNARITHHGATQANPWMNQQLPHSHASMIQQPDSQAAAPPNPFQQGRLAPHNQPLRTTLPLQPLPSPGKRSRESSSSSSNGQDQSQSSMGSVGPPVTRSTVT